MFTKLEEIYVRYNLSKTTMNNYQIIEDYIIGLFNNGIIDNDTNCYLKLHWNGLYYEEIEKDYNKMVQYYLMAIEKNHVNSMYNLGLYYQQIEKDYNQMKKYYLMAIEKDDVNSMNNLGLYYKLIEKDYNRMKDYYLMAIENGCVISMYNLGLYYQNIEKDYNQMIKYYLMAIEKGDEDSMHNLCLYYEKNKKDYGEFYKNLNQIINPNKLIIDKINELKTNVQVQIYLNKIRLFEKLNDYCQLKKML